MMIVSTGAITARSVSAHEQRLGGDYRVLACTGLLCVAYQQQRTIWCSDNQSESGEPDQRDNEPAEKKQQARPIYSPLPSEPADVPR